MGFNCIYADNQVLTMPDEDYYAMGCPPFSDGGAALEEVDDLSQVGTGNIPAISVNVNGGLPPVVPAPYMPSGLPLPSVSLLPIEEPTVAPPLLAASSGLLLAGLGLLLFATTGKRRR
jgi:hypothetical protein